MRKIAEVSRFRAGLTVMAGLGAMALLAPMARAQTTIERGGEIKCSNNLEFVSSASATLVWTTASGAPIATEPALICTPGTPQANAKVYQPLTPVAAEGWNLVITMTGISSPPITVWCPADIGTFDAGGVPHIRFRCVNSSGPGAVTFTLSRNP